MGTDKAKSLLYYGDNLEILGDTHDESVDLIYLDPPFNSNRSYNILFQERTGVEAMAQIEAFTDTWTWSQQSDDQYDQLTGGGAPEKVALAIEGMRRLLGTSDVLAYLVMMTPRLLEMRRVLKSSGSIYLHCDPTASHYLKVMLDAIFGLTNFRNEIVWRRTGSHGPRKSFGPIHDTILFYTKTNDYYFSVRRRPYSRRHVETRYKRDDGTGKLRFISGGNVLTGSGATGGESGAEWKGFDPSAKRRHWAVPGFLSEQMEPEFQELGVLAKLDALYEAGLIRIDPGTEWPVPVRYLELGDGQPFQDMWAYQPGTEGTVYGTEEGVDSDIQWLGPTAPERLGYQTQKPRGLLERILESSCPPGGTVLDPFCGCGTTVDAAQKLGRRWIGIDITYLAIDLIVTRLANTHGRDVVEAFEVHGVPHDEAGAQALWEDNPFDFERWAVSLVEGTPNEKQQGDKGSDGIIRFPHTYEKGSSVGRVVVSVKGGATIEPAMVRELIGSVNGQNADMGVLITQTQPTPGMVEVANKSGSFVWEVNKRSYPKIQLLTIEKLLGGSGVQMPTPYPPYIPAKRLVVDHQLTLDTN